jgi:hypothetical protein
MSLSIAYVNYILAPEPDYATDAREVSARIVAATT